MLLSSYAITSIEVFTLTVLDVENGDTLHLVVRQPTQPQTSSATSSVDASGNIGTQGTVYFQQFTLDFRSCVLI